MATEVGSAPRGAARQPVLRRPTLEGRLDEAFGKRLTLVAAEAGFGKSTLLRSWAEDVDHVWYQVGGRDASLSVFARSLTEAIRTALPSFSLSLDAAVSADGTDAEAASRAEAFGVLLAETFESALEHDLVLIVDDVYELRSPACFLLLETLCRHAPPTLHLVLCTRSEPPFRVERLRGQGEVLDVSAAELAFSVDEVRTLLDMVVADSSELADAVHTATGGWAAAVRLALEALHRARPEDRSALVERLQRPSGPLFPYLAEEVFSREPEHIRALLQRVAYLDRVTVELCDHLELAQPRETLHDLRRRGLLLDADPSSGEWFAPHSLIRDFAREQWPLEEPERQEMYRRAGEWLKAHGHEEEALRSLSAGSHFTELADLLDECGQVLLSAGSVRVVIAAVELLPPGLKSPRMEQLLGQARLLDGDTDGALACFRRAAGDAETLPASLAWQMGHAHHTRRELDLALETYRRARLDGSEPADEALLYSWKASAHFLRGEAEECEKAATTCLELAQACGEPRALAPAHAVSAIVALIVKGDRRSHDIHQARALEAAEEARDFFQVTRIHANLSEGHIQEGRFEAAVQEADIAIPLSELTQFTICRGIAYGNRGDALYGLGRLEEARASLETAKEIADKLEAGLAAGPLMCLGNIFRERGDLSLARGAYENAVRLGEQTQDLQALIPALAGLARVLVREDPEAAERFAEQALSHGALFKYVEALVSAGWIALALGKEERAKALAEKAVSFARERGEKASLAQALELVALTSEPADRQLKLGEAAEVWREVGNPIGEWRARFAAFRFAGDTAAAARAERRLGELGVRVEAAAGAAGLLACVPSPSDLSLAIQTLGGFQVLREGRPVQLAEWKSKKPRDLLKLLVARRGLPTPREQLMEALWPGEDRTKVSNRFSVALSIVRSVLDPEHAYPSEHYIRTDSTALSLANVSIDVETFLSDAEAGLAGESERLEDAEALYAGDFLEEDAYEDWAIPLREDARALYIRVARSLAELSETRGEHAAAARYLRRILERDSYDEKAHLALVTGLASSGEHGEARRAYRTYVSRMDEISVEPVAYPAPERSLKP